MRAMVLDQVAQRLSLEEVAIPVPEPGQLLLRVRACGVCRTDLHVVDGELDRPKLPLVPGHQIVGEAGDGRRVGRSLARVDVRRVQVLPLRPRESLRPRAVHRLRHRRRLRRGAVADERYCFPLPDGFEDAQAAPLLCAGLIGYRSLRLAGDAERVGLYGFGAAAHIVAQVARHEGRRVFAVTRQGDAEAQAFARELGAEWAGSGAPPEELDAAIIFAPAGELVPAALSAVAKGGTVVCAGIHMSDIPSFPYELLWGERVLRSVANLTRRDGEEFLALAPRVPVRTYVETLPLEQANEALDRCARGEVRGALVLVP